MDLDNKSPPEKQDELEYMYYVGHEWEYDFNIGYGADLLEEDALNVKCCLEVLRRLISKADAEIEELEEDLVILQTQLEWNEQNKHEDCSEICCNALREKIHFLELSIQCLKGEVMRKDDNSIPSQDREPAKRILEIINPLLKNHIHKKDEQPEDVAVNDSRSDFHELGDLGDLHTVKRLINSDSQTCSVEEGNELGDLHTVQNFDLYLPVKSDIVTMNNNSETVKVQRTGCVTTGNTDSGSPLNLTGSLH
ncbi:PREDICTED: uncharacterized protein LOC104613441 [Nelumbo nucifera]|uniref:Uncharacterized protein LOC104613441 n=1 Tax=Nelumbo nucifera TaxID=4432 RepID=A0A1U8BPT0_NELNU|nr:PREDICTED: uncharacterized protein LOC104613441 [Nelumbo nucifera]XP_019056041.1 PREDICTED: uncharacterized protein LOC104613441 [Nelumbo nucifera]